jgi:translation initiation factor IF-2
MRPPSAAGQTIGLMRLTNSMCVRLRRDVSEWASGAGPQPGADPGASEEDPDGHIRQAPVLKGDEVQGVADGPTVPPPAPAQQPTPAAARANPASTGTRPGGTAPPVPQTASGAARTAIANSPHPRQMTIIGFPPPPGRGPTPPPDRGSVRPATRRPNGAAL